MSTPAAISEGVAPASASSVHVVPLPDGVSFEQGAAVLANPGRFEPADVLLDKLQEEFGLHDLAIEDALEMRRGFLEALGADHRLHASSALRSAA